MARAKKKARKRQTTAGRTVKPRRTPWLIGTLAVIVVIGLVVFSSRSGKPPASPTGGPAGPVAALVPEQVNPDRLTGRWLRPDGGYVIEIRSAHPDGALEAAYFNPRSINVSHAEWRLDSERLRVFIELRDANYPGSTYTLRYVPQQDRMVGDYFQAVHRQTFNVEFVRQK